MSPHGANAGIAGRETVHGLLSRRSVNHEFQSETPLDLEGLPGKSQLLPPCCPLRPLTTPFPEENPY